MSFFKADVAVVATIDFFRPQLLLLVGLPEGGLGCGNADAVDDAADAEDEVGDGLASILTRNLDHGPPTILQSHGFLWGGKEEKKMLWTQLETSVKWSDRGWRSNARFPSTGCTQRSEWKGPGLKYDPYSAKVFRRLSLATLMAWRESLTVSDAEYEKN